MAVITSTQRVSDKYENQHSRMEGRWKIVCRATAVDRCAIWVWNHARVLNWESGKKAEYQPHKRGRGRCTSEYQTIHIVSVRLLSPPNLFGCDSKSLSLDIYTYIEEWGANTSWLVDRYTT
jgi:hypothetical protein